jgi:beta-phosphoglucomutase
MPPRAVLFDFDGVIADTENHHVASWQRTLAAMGWEVSEEVCVRAMEMDDRAFLSALFEERKIEGGNVEGWVKRKQELTRTMLADSPRIYPGVAAVVNRLRGKVTLGVVTTTWRENAVAVLEATGLRSAFDLIVGKEDTTAPKPDPAGYLRAVESLSLSPREAVALEDSSSGLAAARAAGIKVVAVGHRRQHGPWVGNNIYVSDLRNTDEVLEALGFPRRK